MSPVTRWWVRVIVLLFVGAGTVVLAYHLRDILNPLLAALAIAYALNPLVVKLSKSTFFGKPLASLRHELPPFSLRHTAGASFGQVRVDASSGIT